MVGYKLFVEGGGDAHTLRAACRQGFTEFLKKAGLAGRLPRVVACGGGKQAYDSFRTALSAGERAFLLVDSEDLVEENTQSPWEHLATRPGDRWAQPAGSTDEQCHLVVVCLESWFLADRRVLEDFFGPGFLAQALPPPTRAIESIAKEQVYEALAKATGRCRARAYRKGEHSFKLLALLRPEVVGNASPWAGRFIDELKK